MNPLANANRLKLGVFAMNSDYNARTLPPEKYQLTWANSLDVAAMADKIGLEAIVPLARFRSMADARHHSGLAYECFAWSGAVAARTQHSAIMCTVHVMNVHPILAAKALTTVDHISGGRLALNIVCGWFKEEAEMFGHSLLEHDEGYAYADEWITAVKRLWTEEDEIDFDGRFIRMKRGMSQPKPLQAPHPVLMNAGGSPAGQRFVADHCDVAFIRANRLQDIAAEVEGYRRLARETTGREIQIWLIGSMVHGDTPDDAERLVLHYIDHADQTYIDSYFAHRNKPLSAAEQLALKRKYAFAGGGVPIVGDAESIARQLASLNASGVDGVLMTWIDYQAGVRKFGAEVLPRLEAMGLRAPHSPH